MSVTAQEVFGLAKAYESCDIRTDEEVAMQAKDGCEVALEYLINKYRNFVKAKARSYFLIGADREDIIQEGMIGLYKAIRDFKEDKLSSFRAFAELCITRQIITAIKTATRQKHIPLNSYVSLNKPIYDEDSDRTLLDILSGAKITDPEELMINREEYDNNECAVLRHQRKIPHKHFLLFNFASLLVDQANADTQRNRVCGIALFALIHRILRLTESVTDKL